MSATRRWRVTALLLILLGLAVSAYLLFRTFQLLADRSLTGGDVCSVAFGVSCDALLLSDSSWRLGVPLAGWGVVYYSALLALALLRWLIGAKFHADADMAAFFMACLGALGSIALSALILSGQAALCPLCLVVHATNLLLVMVLKRITQRPLRELVAGAGNALRFAFGGAPGSPDAPWKLSALLNALLVSLLVYQWLYVEARLLRSQTQPPLDPAELVRNYEAAPRHDLTFDDDDPRWGPVDAPAQLVVFSSFQCPGCRQFAAELPALREQFSGTLSIVFQNYPLSTTCNARMPSDRHPRSCQAAWAAQAAAAQGKFWPFHDGLFSLGTQADDESIAQVAREIGLDLPRFEADRESPETLAQVADDVELGSRVAIDATPAVYLNGRHVPQWREGALGILIRHVAGAQAP
jgi:protein-disulfide isomerase/uncharacterized membrane protein